MVVKRCLEALGLIGRLDVMAGHQQIQREEPSQMGFVLSGEGGGGFQPHLTRRGAVEHNHQIVEQPPLW